jgi:hypothetical protein
MMNRLASRAIPYNGCLSLISYANGSDILGLKIRFRNRLSRNLKDTCPNFFGIMLNPTGDRIMLRELFLSARKGR